MLSALIFAILGILFVVNGLNDKKLNKPAGIYPNMKAPEFYEIKDVKAYNRAVGNLVMGYAELFLLNAVLAFFLDPVVLTIVVISTVFLGAIAMMILYEMVIVPKYFFRIPKRMNKFLKD